MQSSQCCKAAVHDHPACATVMLKHGSCAIQRETTSAQHEGATTPGSPLGAAHVQEPHRLQGVSALDASINDHGSVTWKEPKGVGDPMPPSDRRSNTVESASCAVGRRWWTLLSALTECSGLSLKRTATHTHAGCQLWETGRRGGAGTFIYA